MATNFEHPKIDWEAPDLFQEFRRFREHVDFVFAGPLSASDKKAQAGWLGTWIGAQGREIFRTLEWKAGEKENPDKILDNFETYVSPRKNKRIARHKLKSLKQQQNECFAKFLTRLRLMIMDCAYTDPDDMLIDAIIDGVYETKLQERLLDRGEAITLAKTIEICQQFDASKSQIKLIHEQSEISVNVIKKSTGTTEKVCNRCGGRHKENAKCPAIGTTCAYCKKKGHWAKVCFKNKQAVNLINQVSETAENDSDDTEVLSLFMLSGKSKDKDKWVTNLDINGLNIPVRIDTGAKCNTITAKLVKSMPEAHLEQSDKRLKSFSNHITKPICTANLKVSNKHSTAIIPFEVIDFSQENIISGDTAEQLNLITRVSKISAQNNLLKEYPQVSENSGTLPGEYQIKLKEGAKGVIHAPRRPPLALKEKIVNKLKQMEDEGHITKVTTPTEWVNSMTVVAKEDKVRICLDPQDLNKQIKREHYPMKTIEQIVSEIPKAKVFTTLDAKSGFLQIKLTQESSFLTTFNTPIGRYRWLRLPFGISCAPEVFQRIMDEMLEGITGAFAVIDDILVAGETVEQHDQILKQVLQRACEYNLKLNFDKVKVRQDQVSYVGHLITKDGLKPDPEKVKAMNDMPHPTCKQSTRRLLGFVTYLSKFLPHLSTVTEPIRQLLKEEVMFEWGSPQEQAFQDIKRLCTSCPVLKFYDVDKPVEIQCDASSTGLGAILLQEGKPVAYSSRAMTTAETRYAQIEKELLSIVFACKQFHCYIFGKPTVVLNDHKPLENIFQKPLHMCPLRLQRMLLYLQWYDLEVKYTKGSNMTLADTLSRAYTAPPENVSEKDIPIHFVVSVSAEKELLLREATGFELQVLKEIITTGWPENKCQVPQEVLPYWKCRSELTIMDGFILKNNQLVIPPSHRSDVLKLIHQTHLGIVKCKQRAREVVYWPNMNADIEELISNCERCATFQKSQANQPLLPLPAVNFPFERMSADLFEFEGEYYFLGVDNYSKFIMVYPITNVTASTIIKTMKHIISSHGIPSTLVTDSGSQFTSEEFRQFCAKYNIQLHIVSPHYQRANGMAERAIQTVKKLWRKGADKYLAILDYNTTPLESLNKSPAQILMSRRPRNLLPVISKTLVPSLVNPAEVKNHAQESKEKQKKYHDSLPNQTLTQLYPGQEVRVAPMPGTREWFPAVVREKRGDRTYQVENRQTKQKYTRNRVHLRISSTEANKKNTPVETEREEETQESEPVEQTSDHSSDADHQVVCTRSGRQVRPPDRLDL